MILCNNTMYRFSTPRIIKAHFYPQRHNSTIMYIVELTELELLRKFLLFLVFLLLQALIQCSVVNCSLRALCNRSKIVCTQQLS